MAKEFKDFEKRWSRAQISAYIAIEGAWLFDFDGLIEVGMYTSRWVHAMMQWNMVDIRHCVYESVDHEEWQMFRIALKRFSTVEKLCALNVRWETYVAGALDTQVNWSDFNFRAVRERCRIENYINALKRGGQLDTSCRVVR